MIHKLSRFLMTLVALFAMTTGAWAEGTVYSSSVDVHTLQPDDILIEGASITGIESSYGLKVMPYFLRGQYGYNTLYDASQAIANSYAQVKIIEGGVLELTRTDSDNQYTYTPCDADRNPFNAWIVTQIEDLGSDAYRVQITGYQYGSAEVEADINPGEKTNLLDKLNQAKNSGLTLNVGTGDNAYTLNFDKDAVNSILEGNPEEVNIETTFEEGSQTIGTTSVLAKLIVNLTNESGSPLNFSVGKAIASLKFLGEIPTGRELQAWYFDNVNNLPTELIPSVYDAVMKMVTITMSHFSTYGLLLYDPEAIVVTPTENQNEWTFTMPNYDVEVNVEYETALALNEETDNAVTLEEWDGYEADVTLTRTLTAGMWNTLAVPFSISVTNYAALQQLLSAQGGSIVVKQLSSTELSDNTLTLNFTDAISIEAGKPYLVKVTKALNFATLPAIIDALGSPVNPFKEVEVSKTPVPTETTYVDFIPTLGKTTITGDDAKTALFLAEENKLKNPTTLPADMKGFRAYFQLKGDATSARSFSLNLGGESTGVEEFTNSRIEKLKSYDLQGRRINGAIKKGVYIMNGKKTIIK